MSNTHIGLLSPREGTQVTFEISKNFFRLRSRSFWKIGRLSHKKTGVLERWSLGVLG